jgi:hypothetical protein
MFDATGLASGLEKLKQLLSYLEDAFGSVLVNYLDVKFWMLGTLCVRKCVVSQVFSKVGVPQTEFNRRSLVLSLHYLDERSSFSRRVRGRYLN